MNRRGFLKSVIVLSVSAALPASGAASRYISAATPMKYFTCGNKSFAAFGDWVRDDSDALRNAMSYALASGSSVYIPPGNYRVQKIGRTPQGGRPKCPRSREGKRGQPLGKRRYLFASVFVRFS